MTLEKVRQKLQASSQFNKRSQQFSFIHPISLNPVIPVDEKHLKLKAVFRMEEVPKILIQLTSKPSGIEEVVEKVFFLSSSSFSHFPCATP